jgi:hypothetical protein
MITAKLLREFKDIQHALSEMKDAEMEMRKMIAIELLQDAPPGTHTYEIGDVTVKVTRSLTHSLDADLLETLTLSPQEEACIKRKPTLSLTEYKKLGESERQVLDMAISVKDAAPTVKIALEGDL